MPILVHCPNGCKIRAPESKAGKVVRCPECKSLIQIAPANQIHVESTDATVSSKLYCAPGESPDRTHEDPGLANLPGVLEVTGTESLPSTIEIPEFEPPKNNRLKVQEIKSRTELATEDRILLARVYAGLICVVGVINLLPFAISWVQAYQVGDLFTLDRWMYLQVFLAGLHFVYAIFLVQVSDWAALRTVAVAMLLIAMMFGAVTTGILLGGDGGSIPQFLELRGDLLRRGTYWCVALLVMTTLFSYMSGRESSNWKRTEQLLGEILASRGATKS